jgi:hypothetical protein
MRALADNGLGSPRAFWLMVGTAIEEEAKQNKWNAISYIQRPP